jgi:hypothetical protein
MTNENYLDIYKRYLNKFETNFGEVDFDDTVQHRGRLVRKLRYDDFVDAWTEYRKIEDYLREVMTKGATLNDEVNRKYAELASAVLENPKDFMLL